MTRPRSRYPVSSFGPELMDILIRGSRERVEIPCPDQRTMQHIQARLQMLRGAMEREKHPQYAVVTRARTSRTWDSEKGKNADCVLVIQPNDAQFAPIFKNAGIVPTPHTRDLLDNLDETAPTADVIDPLDPYAKFK